MKSNQAKLLSKLSQKIKAEHKDKNVVLASLQEAKILNKKGEFTSHYKNLAKVGFTK